MLGVATYIENGTFENDWDYALSNLKPDEIYLMDIGYQPTNNVLKDIPLLTCWDQLPDMPIVLMSPQTSRNYAPTIGLHDFVHPDDAIYIFGPNNQHVTPECFGSRAPDHIVNIPTDTVDEHFAHTAYLLTAWDRRHRG